MELFDKEWERTLEKRYTSKSRFFKPFIFKLTFNPQLKGEKDKLEKLSQSLPKEIQPEIFGRLRSTNNIHHFSAYQELVLFKILASLGYSVFFQPEFQEGKPDLLVSGGNLVNPVIIEVATVFDDPNWQKEEEKLDRILEHLDKIEHHFLLNISVLSEIIPSEIDFVRLEQFVKHNLDHFYNINPDEHYEFEYNNGGLELSFYTFSSKGKTSIVGSYGLSARSIGTNQIRHAINKKINKYKSIVQNGYIYVLALDITDTPSGEDGLIDVLFGRLVVRMWNDKKSGKLVKMVEDRDSSGLFRPKPGLGGIVQNTRLSAIISMKSSWIDRKIDELANRKHFLKVIHNPSATVPLGQTMFQNLPQYVNISTNPKMVEMNWINKEADNAFYC